MGKNLGRHAGENIAEFYCYGPIVAESIKFCHREAESTLPDIFFSDSTVDN